MAFGAGRKDGTSVVDEDVVNTDMFPPSSLSCGNMRTTGATARPSLPRTSFLETRAADDDDDFAQFNGSVRPFTTNELYNASTADFADVLDANSANPHRFSGISRIPRISPWVRKALRISVSVT